MEKPVKPVLKYAGAKWRIGESILSYFPPHTHYIEPFCGSAALFFLKQPSEHEVLNDIHHSVYNFFKVMRERGEELVRVLELTPWSEEEYGRCEHDYVCEDELEHARRFAIRCWQAHGTQTGKTSGWRHNGTRGRAYPTRLWQTVPDRLRHASQRLRDAEIRNRPALEIIAYYSQSDALIYCDPPYIKSTRSSEGHYTHEMKDAEHEALLDALEASKSMVILSGYAHPMYDERLKHWMRVEIKTVAEAAVPKVEILWINPLAASRQPLQLFGGQS